MLSPREKKVIEDYDEWAWDKLRLSMPSERDIDLRMTTEAEMRGIFDATG